MNEFLIDVNGTKVWYDLKSDEYSFKTFFKINGISGETAYISPHREVGPAIIYSNGTEEYRIKGKLHREDGPAIVTGAVYSWWINALFYSSFDEWCKKLNKSPEEVTFLKLKYNMS